MNGQTKSNPDRVSHLAKHIQHSALIYGQRTGQYLFNSLTPVVADKVRGTNFDPFYLDLTIEGIIQWLEDHIIFNDNGSIGCLFNGYEILWEED
jgi:hypothetical protein